MPPRRRPSEPSPFAALERAVALPTTEPRPIPGLPTRAVALDEPRAPLPHPCPPDTSGGALGASAPGSLDDLEQIIWRLLPATMPSDLMARRGRDAQRAWAQVTATPLYEAMTVWVMAAWPDQVLERVDTMARTAIAAAHQVRDGRWSAERLAGVVAKAGRRAEHYPVHRHLGQEVQFVSYDELGFDLADESPGPRPAGLSLGPAVVADLRLALGEHAYLLTPAAARLLDRAVDLAVDHLNTVRARSATAGRPERLSGLALFAAARPTRRAAKSNRITDVFRDLPHPTSVALAHLLLGTDHRPEASLLWRHLCGVPTPEAPAEVVADWRAELPALSPAVLALSERRRRRVRDRCRRGDDLHHAFELAATAEPDHPSLARAS